MARARVLTGVLVAAALVAPQSASASASNVVARVSRSVVVVLAPQRQGSGFAFGSPGNYLTNAHVVAGSNKVVLVDPDGRRQVATVIADNPTIDVAQLRGSVALPPLSADGRAPAAGDPVLTVGAPGGLQGTVTEGIVSAASRQVNGVAMIQANLAVNPGNSGGPLVSSSGQLLGITSDRANGEEAIAFAIPIATATRALAHAGPPSVKPVPSSTWIVALTAASILAGLALAAVLWRRTRRSALSTPTQRCTRLAPPAAGEQAEEPLVIVRHRSKEQTPAADSSPQSPEEIWT